MSFWVGGTDNFRSTSLRVAGAEISILDSKTAVIIPPLCLLTTSFFNSSPHPNPLKTEVVR